MLNDYLVSYETDCHPEFESCFVGCVDEACTEEYYYATIERHAAELKSICGKDISNCEEAYYCPESAETLCEVIYCDIETDETCSDIINI